MAAGICSFHKTGYCKYQDRCQKQHVKDICNSSSCSGDCFKRHPKICRYYKFYGTCKFSNNCAYLHKKLGQTEIELLRQEICELQRRIFHMDDQLKALLRREVDTEKTLEMSKADGISKNSQFSPSLHESNFTESLSSNLVASTLKISESAGIPQVDGTADFTLTEVTDKVIEETEKQCNF